MPTDTEVPIPLQSVGFTINLGEVVPHPQQMRIAQSTNPEKQASIGAIRQKVQPHVRTFFYLQRPKEHLIGRGIVDAFGLVIGHREPACPYFVQRRLAELRQIGTDNRTVA
jgi:hypothetical protein